MSARRSPDTMTARGRGREPNQMRSSLINAGGWERWCTSSGGGLENNGASSGLAMVSNLTVADENVLQCGICFLPLKPPIFQCAVGHALCSPCSTKLKAARKCHLCRVAMPRGYQRCHAMEDVVNSIRVPCPHARHGCDAKPAYHGREEHLLQCPHAPCHCPGDTCSFVGPVEALTSHLMAAHGWPCTDEVAAGASFSVYLRNGFNFLTAVRGGVQYLLLLNMASTPFGHAVSAVWLRSPSAIAISSSSSAPATVTTTTTRNMTCHLELYFMQFKHQREHYDRSRFQVEGRCPSDGLPDPNTSFQFFVPNYGGGITEPEEAVVYVIASISIRSS